MIHEITGAVPPRTAQHHQNPVHLQGRQQAETSSPDRTVLHDRAPLGQENRAANASHRAHRHDGDDHGHRIGGHRGNVRQRFNDVVGAAVFAFRMHMEKRAEMHEIRTEIRGLMGEVDGGQLTPHQQETFDGLVGRIVELRNSHDSKHRRPADADVISARILNRFGVEAAPSGVPETSDAGIGMQAPDHTRTITTHSTA